MFCIYNFGENCLLFGEIHVYVDATMSHIMFGLQYPKKLGPSFFKQNVWVKYIDVIFPFSKNVESI